MNLREEKACERVRSYLDAHLDGEVSDAADDAIASHLEVCAACAGAFEAHARIKNHLRRAVRSETAPAALRVKIRNQIRATQQGFSFAFPQSGWALAAVLAVLCVGAWAAGSLWHRQQASSAIYEANLDRARSERTSAWLGVGLGDHVHCAIKSGFANQRFTFDEMSHHLGADYTGLTLLVKENVGAGFEVVVAHQCLFGGRRFVHLILRRGEMILSLVITKKNGESFSNNDDVAMSPPSGAPLYHGRLQEFEIAAFETPSHFVFVVSNLQASDNLQVASKVAPSVRNFLAKL